VHISFDNVHEDEYIAEFKELALDQRLQSALAALYHLPDKSKLALFLYTKFPKKDLAIDVL